MQRDQLLSAEYRDLQRLLHARPDGYGRSGAKNADPVLNFAADTGSRSILDYGCGEGRLKAALRDRGWTGSVHEYDPCLPSLDAEPEPADLVVCTDVLEHIEPECLDNVLSHLRSLSLKHGYFLISTVVAGKTLADGRNAHLIVQPPEWWEMKLRETGWRIREMRTGHKDVSFMLDTKAFPER
jgi:2-polyprenyl-3-methyl-5-hydroxy-6-metoxy-1,4-benzoquinol methylase